MTAQTAFIFSDIKTGEQVLSILGTKQQAVEWIDSNPEHFLWFGTLVVKQLTEYRLIAGLATIIMR